MWTWAGQLVAVGQMGTRSGKGADSSLGPGSSAAPPPQLLASPSRRLCGPAHSGGHAAPHPKPAVWLTQRLAQLRVLDANGLQSLQQLS